MKRTPLVLASTVAGLTGVAVFHSTPQKVVLSALGSSATANPAASTPSSATPTATSAPSTTATPSTAAASATGASSGPTAPPTTSTSVASNASRSATGPVVNYYYGQLSVKVTASGTKIAAITIATLSDGGNPYSAYVDHAALPMLQREAMSAQSAKIQGVSGASYTSAGFAQSLQGALSALKLK
ncbi:MAG: FMN-binding protein [Acidimicrobiales bacterium]